MSEAKLLLKTKPQGAPGLGTATVCLRERELKTRPRCRGNRRGALDRFTAGPAVMRNRREPPDVWKAGSYGGRHDRGPRGHAEHALGMCLDTGAERVPLPCTAPPPSCILRPPPAMALRVRMKTKQGWARTGREHPLTHPLTTRGGWRCWGGREAQWHQHLGPLV